MGHQESKIEVTILKQDKELNETLKVQNLNHLIIELIQRHEIAKERSIFSVVEFYNETYDSWQNLFEETHLENILTLSKSNKIMQKQNSEKKPHEEEEKEEIFKLSLRIKNSAFSFFSSKPLIMNIFPLLDHSNLKFIVQNLGGFPKSMGDGIFGNVFFGEFAHSNSKFCPVIVKRIEIGRKFNIFEVMRTVENYRSADSIYIVKTYGITLEEESKNRFFGNVIFQSGDMNLRKFLKKNTDLSRDKLIEIALNICCGLKYLRVQFGIVHKDVGMSNIIYFENEKIFKISDYGLRSVGLCSTESDGSSAIDPLSAAPETLISESQNSDFQNYNYNSNYSEDIYGLGCILFEMFEKRKPFKKIIEGINDPLKAARKLLRIFNENNNYNSVEFIKLKNDEKLSKLIGMCLRRDPLKRPNIESVIKMLVQAKRNGMSFDEFLIKNGISEFDSESVHFNFKDISRIKKKQF